MRTLLVNLNSSLQKWGQTALPSAAHWDTGYKLEYIIDFKSHDIVPRTVLGFHGEPSLWHEPMSPGLTSQRALHCTTTPRRPLWSGQGILINFPIHMTSFPKCNEVSKEDVLGSDNQKLSQLCHKLWAPAMHIYESSTHIELGWNMQFLNFSRIPRRAFLAKREARSWEMITNSSLDHAMRRQLLFDPRCLWIYNSQDTVYRLYWVNKDSIFGRIWTQLSGLLHCDAGCDLVRL